MKTHQPSTTFKIPEKLPIFLRREEIVNTIRSHQVVVISGETGSGKSTILPLLCVKAGCIQKGRLAVTQPRRIAALSLARYVSSLILPKTENYVGSKVRFHDTVSVQTKIKFVTDGILLAELSSDPLLTQYDTIIVDEAHERTCNIDFLLGYLRTLLLKRPCLKLIISSATLDTDLFSRSFHEAPILTITGRNFPVQIEYKPILAMWEGERVRSYLEYVVKVIDEIITRESIGDILLFLPTVQDIIDTVFMLKNKYKDKSAIILPLYSKIRVVDQKKIFRRYPCRKIVIATNIAETSITVPGIRFVIDTGLARVMRYEPSLHTSRIPIERISRASVEQRAGRCGRVGDGICIRLFSQNDYNSRPRYPTPEIKRTNIAGIILRMYHLKLGKIERFPFLQRPSSLAISEAYRQLKSLGALDSSHKLTPLGSKMAVMPLDPPVACMLLSASKHGAVKEVSIIASALSVEDPRIEMGEKSIENKGNGGKLPSDFTRYLEIWDAFQSFSGNRKINSRKRRRIISFGKSLKEKRILNKRLYTFCNQNSLSYIRMREWLDVHEQISIIGKKIDGQKENTPTAGYEAIHKSLLCGLSENIAYRQNNGLYKGIHNHDIALVSNSKVLKNKTLKKDTKWVVIHEIVETRRIYGRTAASIKPQWVEQLFFDQCKYYYTGHYFDSESGVIKASEMVVFRGLPLIQNRVVNFSQKFPEYARSIFIKEALVKGEIGNNYNFLTHNNKCKKEVELLEHKYRDKEIYAGDSALEDFYNARIPQVSSVQELNKTISDKGNDQFLFVCMSDLMTKSYPAYDNDYPDEIIIGNTRLNLVYRYALDSENDGVTVTAPIQVFQAVPPYYWEWFLPTFWLPRVKEIINLIFDYSEMDTLEKPTITETVIEMLKFRPCPFIDAVLEILRDKFGIQIPINIVDSHRLSRHLWVRIVVVNENGECIGMYRPPLCNIYKINNITFIRHPFWESFCKDLERSEIVTWDFGELPQYVEIGSADQLFPLPAMRALCCEQDSISIRVFLSFDAANISHSKGIMALLEQSIARELAWTIRQIKLPEVVIERFKRILDKEKLHHLASHLFIQTVLALPEVIPRDEISFSKYRVKALKKIHESSRKLINLISEVSEEFEKCCRQIEKIKKRNRAVSLYRHIVQDAEAVLDEYMNQLFSSNGLTNFIFQLPRYLKALWWRIETGYINPGRYIKCMKKINLYRQQYKNFKNMSLKQNCPEKTELRDLHGMIEELGISLFAQQKVRTLYPISEEKVKDRIELLKQGVFTIMETRNAFSN